MIKRADNSLRYCTLRFFYVLILSFLSIASLRAEIIFSAPPRESPDQGLKTYGELVTFLSSVLGETVVYEHPGGWPQYTNNMRNGRYDIVFDAPHFGAWRIRNISHIPVARLPGNLEFAVVVKRELTAVRTVRDLLSVKVCTLASPNLGTITFYNLFSSPIYHPRIYEVKGGFKGVYKALKEGKCDAAVLRDSFYRKLNLDEQKQLAVVVTTKPIPNQTITISHRLSPKKDLIAKQLVSTEGNQAAAKLLKRFGGPNDSLLSIKNKEFDQFEDLLTGVIWGW